MFGSNILRKKVSGTRNRYIKDGYNIDLSYIIQNRIIVMSYPAEGVEANYRNDYRQVQKFLNEKHPKKYKVFNVSERTYDISRFENRVENYNW